MFLRGGAIVSIPLSWPRNQFGLILPKWRTKRGTQTLHQPSAGSLFLIHRSCLLMSAFAGLLMITGAYAADDQQQHKKTPSETAPQQQSPAPAPGKPVRIGIPSPQNLFIMIRTSLIALHQANVTGNYSVLRDLSAPSFQQANSVEQLSTAFAGLRTRGGDMAPIVLALPTLSRPPTIDEKGMLRLAGYFDTKPNELHFELVFQVVDGFWRLNAIGAQFRQPQVPGSSTPAKDASPSPSKAAKQKAQKVPR